MTGAAKPKTAGLGDLRDSDARRLNARGVREGSSVC
jgi:hypothetical protein